MKIITLDVCDSTNTYLKNHYEQLKDKLPVLVTSGLQTGGRGRERRKWVSPKGKGIYSSFGFNLGARQNLSLLPLIAGISVIEALKRISALDLGLKWPNDVLLLRPCENVQKKQTFEMMSSRKESPGTMLGGLGCHPIWEKGNKKIAGILIENVIMETRLFCITGIGINLNQTTKDFPEDLRDKAVSLKMATGSEENYPVETVNRVLSDVFFQWLGRMEGNEREVIIETANGYSAFLMDGPISFHHTGGIVNGIFKGIHQSGGLILGDESGGTSLHYSGEILG